MKGDAPSYSGPDQIEGYYTAADEIIKRRVDAAIKPEFKGELVKQPCPYPEESQRTFLTLWVSGCREGEAVLLEPGQWRWNEEAIRGLKVPVLKKREKVRDAQGNVVYREIQVEVMQPNGSIQTQTIYRPLSRRKVVYRDHVMPADMPLGQRFIDMVHTLKEDGYRYILYRTLPFYKDAMKDDHMGERTVQNRITELHPDLFPHGIRALQVRYLRDRYGDDFDIPDLKDHFMWSSTEMAIYYLSAQKRAKKMGIKHLPT